MGVLGLHLGATHGHGDPDAGPVLDAPLLASPHAIDAFNVVEYWVGEGSALAWPRQTDAQASQLSRLLPRSIHVTGCLGVRVTLRKDGLTLGAGEVVFDDPIPPLEAMAPMRDLVPLLRDAVTQALEAVDQSLADAHLKAVIAAPDPTQVPPRKTVRDVGRELSVDLQLARRRQSIRIGRTEEYHAIFRSFAPGYHGLILRNPAMAGPAWLWPATALASNIQPRSQVVQLLADQQLKSDALVSVARPGGPTLDRFEVIHVVRALRGLPPMILVRGNAPSQPISQSRGQVIGLAQSLARHLEARIGVVGEIAGTYHPTSDTYDPAIAPDDERALALYALVRWTNLQKDVATPGKRNHQVARKAVEATVRLAEDLTGEGVRVDPAATALAMMTLIESRLSVDHKPLRDRLASRLMSLRNEAGLFANLPADPRNPNAPPRAINHPTQSLIVAALSALYEQTREPEVADAVRANIGGLWQAMDHSLQVTSLPWLMRAEMRMIRLDADAAAGDDQARQAKARYLGDLIDRLARRQIVEVPELGPDDVVGGFDLIGSGLALLPIPDWRSTFVLDFIAQALREEGIAQGRDRLGWLLTCGLSARFVALLTFDDPACFYVRSRDDAVGGVRLAFWDNRLPAASTAMALLALVEFEQSMFALEGEYIPPPDRTPRLTDFRPDSREADEDGSAEDEPPSPFDRGSPTTTTPRDRMVP